MNRGDAVQVRVGPKGELVCAFESEGTCRGANCGEQILWVRTPGGRPMPVDPEEDAEGRHEPHFATCPDRRDFEGGAG